MDRAGGWLLVGQWPLSSGWRLAVACCCLAAAAGIWRRLAGGVRRGRRWERGRVGTREREGVVAQVRWRVGAQARGHGSSQARELGRARVRGCERARVCGCEGVRARGREGAKARGVQDARCTATRLVSTHLVAGACAAMWVGLHQRKTAPDG